MAPMTPAFDLRSAAGWFRLIALAEAVSWVGLLIGMYFKYVGTPRTEIVRGGRTARRNRLQMDGQNVAAGFAGEHRAIVQCDFPHMGRSDGTNGACGGRFGRRATGTARTGNDVTDLGA
jgi:hypothetical protein